MRDFILYSCHVCLKGDIRHQVPKILTAPEILVMFRVHGADSVRDIEVYDSVDRDSNTERERLQFEYDQFLTVERGGRNPTSIDQMFGPYAELPRELPENIFRDPEAAFEDVIGSEDIDPALRELARKASNGRKAKGAPPKTPAPAQVQEA